MAASEKSSARARWHKANLTSTSPQKTTTSPDYWALVVLLVIMTAMFALIMWLASLGGGNTPVDSWMLMP